MYLLLLGNNKAVRKHQKIGIRSLVRYLKISIKFKKLECDENKQLNFLLNSEKKLKDIIKTLYLKECLTKKKEYVSIYPTGSRPGILYGSAKVHKPIIDNCPSFRPILSRKVLSSCFISFKGVVR